MLLGALIVLLVVFIFLGMEVSWAIGMACLAYLVLADVTLGGVVYRQFPHYGLAPVGDGHFVTCSQEIDRHRSAHLAEPDKTDLHAPSSTRSTPTWQRAS